MAVEVEDKEKDELARPGIQSLATPLTRSAHGLGEKGREANHRHRRNWGEGIGNVRRADPYLVKVCKAVGPFRGEAWQLPRPQADTITALEERITQVCCQRVI